MMMMMIIRMQGTEPNHHLVKVLVEEEMRCQLALSTIPSRS